MDVINEIIDEKKKTGKQLSVDVSLVYALCYLSFKNQPGL